MAHGLAVLTHRKERQSEGLTCIQIMGIGINGSARRIQFTCRSSRFLCKLQRANCLRHGRIIAIVVIQLLDNFSSAFQITSADEGPSIGWSA